MGHSFREVDGKPHRVVPAARQPRPRRRRAAQGRLAHADRARDQGRRRARTSPRFREVYEDLIAQDPRRLAVARRHAGRDHDAHQPGRHRHRRLGAAPDAGPGLRSSRPARSRTRPACRRRPARLAELGVSKVMTMTSTYDHRVIQGAESGAFLRPDRGAAPAAATASTRRSSRASASSRPAAPPTAAPRRRAGRARRRRRPRRCSPTCRRPPRWSRRTACTATSPRTSTRSAPSRSATRRSSRRPSG